MILYRDGQFMADPNIQDNGAAEKHLEKISSSLQGYRPKARSTYYYWIEDQHGIKWIQIIDCDEGRSVTNDIENVIADIEHAEGINAEEYVIIYQDTDTNWDGWDKKNGDFFLVGGGTNIEAQANYISRYR